MVRYAFKANKSKVLGSGYRLYRKDGWTTNGFIAIKEEIEPKYIAELKEKTESVPDIQKVFRDIDEHEYLEAEVTPRLYVSYQNVYVELKAEGFCRYANVYYISLFESIERRRIKFYIAKDTYKILVKDHLGGIIGLVMCVRYDPNNP